MIDSFLDYSGFETARSLALRGCHVVLACRNLTQAQNAASALRQEQSQVKVDVIHLDLASLKSVKKCATEYEDRGWLVWHDFFSHNQ